MWGRGAGDMKSGVAAYLLAVEAFLEVCGPPRGDLLFTSVIEEECGGNGMRAVLAAGYDADETLIGEPFWPGLGNGGVGRDLGPARRPRQRQARGARRRGGGAGRRADRRGRRRSRALEAELNASGGDPLFSGAFAHPYNLNLGEIAGGVWPSSVPTDATLRIRLGFGRDLEPAEAQAPRRRARRRRGADRRRDVRRLPRPRLPPRPEATPLADVVGARTPSCTARRPAFGVFTGTTDARYVTGPCYCYGPLAGNLHGIDEWVDLASCRERGRDDRAGARPSPRLNGLPPR